MKNRIPKIPTPSYLSNVALHYLERYAASEASLRRVLMNRLRRAALSHPDFSPSSEVWQNLLPAIETIIAQHQKTGVINDASFAEMKVGSLRRQGRSRRAIAQKLLGKGIKGALVSEALRHHAEENGVEDEEAEYTAALALARRRKWGPFRTRTAPPEQIRKDFASLARAGFSSAIAQRVLKAEPLEETL